MWLRSCDGSTRDGHQVTFYEFNNVYGMVALRAPSLKSLARIVVAEAVQDSEVW